MHPSVDTTRWFRQRNLVAGLTPTPASELPREVEIYLLVTFAHRPHDLPVELRVWVAARFFGQCGGDRTVH